MVWSEKLSQDVSLSYTMQLTHVKLYEQILYLQCHNAENKHTQVYWLRKAKTERYIHGNLAPRIYKKTLWNYKPIRLFH